MVSDNAALLSYDGYLSDTDKVIFRNVNVADLEPVSADIGGSRGCLSSMSGRRPLIGQPCLREDAEDGSFSISFQAIGDHYVRANVQFTQVGSDVAARVLGVGYGWGSAHTIGETRGVGNQTLSDTVLDMRGETLAVKRIRCNLKSGSFSVSAPRRIVLKNDSIGMGDGEIRTARYDGCFSSKEWTTIFRGASLAGLVSVSAQLGGSLYGGGWRNAISCNASTNELGDVVYWQFQAKSGNWTGCLQLAFRQDGEDIVGKVDICTRAYGEDPGTTKWNGYHELFANTLASSPDAAELAIGNLVLTWRELEEETVRQTCSDYLPTNACQRIFADLDYGDVETVSVQVAGSEAYSQKNDALVIYPQTNNDESVSWQVQYQPYNFYVGILRLEQDGADLNAYYERLGYQWTGGKDGDKNKLGTYKDPYNYTERPKSQTIDGAEISICGVSVTAKRRRSETFSFVEFSNGVSPVVLKDANLVLAPSAGMTDVISGRVYGRGSVQKSGAGTAVLQGNLDNLGKYGEPALEINAGTFRVAGPRNVAGLVMVKGGTLMLNAAEPLTVGSLELREGATIALSSEVAVESGVMTLVSGAGLTSDDLTGVAVRLEGAGFPNHKAKLVVAENGDLQVEVNEKKGMLLIFR